ncbi:MAG: nicotinate (nicotinamide) nucleotide adenylyltransferase [Planctomycetes bacterium]|nr:nicotinate (nicotinamide) nucleotide adenylyltransferase [Planctomycetota bacterium]
MDRAAVDPAPGAPPGLAVLGGTFDPPHSSHARLAAAALAQLPIDRLLVIPAGDHPHKQDRGVTPAADRLAMCERAFADQPRVRVDAREIRRGGLSFTVDTLEELRREHPDRAIYFLIGSDNLPLLPTWYRHHRLLELATIVTYPRAGHPVAAADLDGLDLSDDEKEHLLEHVLQLPADDVNSTALRRRLRAGDRSLAEIHPDVLTYIDHHGLYRP